jgi:hypothetical protein
MAAHGSAASIRRPAAFKIEPFHGQNQILFPLIHRRLIGLVV